MAGELLNVHQGPSYGRYVTIDADKPVRWNRNRDNQLIELDLKQSTRHGHDE